MPQGPEECATSPLRHILAQGGPPGRPVSRQTRKVWVGTATEWPSPSLLRGQMEEPVLRPHSRSHMDVWLRWKETGPPSPPDGRTDGRTNTPGRRSGILAPSLNTVVLDQRGEATGPGSQSHLEFEPGWSCLTRSSQGASPLPRHSPQGAKAGHRAQGPWPLHRPWGTP